MAEEDILQAVADAGGFGFVAHPWSKGARILERYGRFVKRGGIPRLARARPGRRSPASSSGASPPTPPRTGAARSTPSATCGTPRRSSTARGPRTSSPGTGSARQRRFVAIGGLDAHQHGDPRARAPVEPDAKRPLLRHALHLCVADRGAEGRRARRSTTSSSSTTRFGRAAATSRSTRSRPGRGFRYWGESADGSSAMMGEEHPAGALTLRVSAPREARHRPPAETASRSPRPIGTALEHEVTGARRLPGRGPPQLAKARAPVDLLEPDLPPLGARLSARSSMHLPRRASGDLDARPVAASRDEPRSRPRLRWKRSRRH